MSKKKDDRNDDIPGESWRDRMLRMVGVEKEDPEAAAARAEAELNERTGVLIEHGDISQVKRIAPEMFLVENTHVQVGDEYARTLYAVGLPADVSPNWLAPLLRFPETMDVSFFIHPLDKKHYINKLRLRLAKDEAQLTADMEAGQLTRGDVERRYHELRELLRLLEADQTRPFQVTVVITVRGSSPQELDEICDLMERRLSTIDMRRASLRHKDGFLTTLPFMQNRLRDSIAAQNVHTQGLQTFFPLTAQDIAHSSGVLYGVNPATSGQVMINRFGQPKVANPGGIVLGIPGSGKSFLAKIEMLQWAEFGYPVTIIDPQNEYDRLCEGLGGQFISIAAESPHKINPLDFSAGVYPGLEEDLISEKVTRVIEFVEVLLRSGNSDPNAGGLNARQRQYLDKAIVHLYKQRGFVAGDVAAQRQAKPEEMPLLSDLHAILEEAQIANRDPQFQLNIEPIVAGLDRYVHGSLGRLFNQPTNIDMSSHFVVFNILNTPESLMPLVMHMILEHLSTTLFTRRQVLSGQGRLLYVDEAHRLMALPETANFLEHVARTARKFNVGLTVLTQDVDQFLMTQDNRENKAGRGILQQCATVVLLKQHMNSLNTLKSAFKLSDNEAMYLGTVEAGKGLIFVGDERVWFDAEGLASPMEYEMITTNPTEVAAINRRKLEGATQPDAAQVAYTQSLATGHAPAQIAPGALAPGSVEAEQAPGTVAGAPPVQPPVQPPAQPPEDFPAPPIPPQP